MTSTVTVLFILSLVTLPMSVRRKPWRSWVDAMCAECASASVILGAALGTDGGGGGTFAFASAFGAAGLSAFLSAPLLLVFLSAMAQPFSAVDAAASFARCVRIVFTRARSRRVFLMLAVSLRRFVKFLNRPWNVS